MSAFTLNYPLFDGEKVIEGASVTIENGIITSVTEGAPADADRLLMPSLIDAHTHITDKSQIDTMLSKGISAACDISAPPRLIEQAKPFTVVSSAGMTVGTLNGSGYVDKAVSDGAKYIKVLLFEPNLMPKGVLKSICLTAHEHRRKVAVHATSVKAESMAVDCGADILLHIPMKERYPHDLAAELAERGIAVAPTLVMMRAFAESGKSGYKAEHYLNAENAVGILHEHGVTLLAATDANTGALAPEVEYGASMHTETALMHAAGLSLSEVLASATGKTADVFGIDGVGYIREGKKADLILVDGRPDRDIAAIKNIRKMWIHGEPVIHKEIKA